MQKYKAIDEHGESVSIYYADEVDEKIEELKKQIEELKTVLLNDKNYSVGARLIG